jgi:hypothetical protein
MSHANWGSRAGVTVLVFTLTAGSGNAAAEPVHDDEDLAVRSTDVAVAGLIETAGRESPTFRSMVESIRSAKGIVYIIPGKCGHGVRSCLVDVLPAGGRRILRVKVDVRKPDPELMASIGHELRHALEVLSDPSVKSGNAMFHFFKRTATMGAGRTFETPAAVLAGDTVGREIREFRRREGAR